MTLKQEYKNQVVKVNTGFGLVTFNTTETPESDYQTFYNLGFDFCFEPEAPKYKQPIRYTGVPQEKAGLTKRNKKNDVATSKTKAKKA